MFRTQLVLLSMESLKLSFWFAGHIICVYTKFECFISHTRVRVKWPQQLSFFWLLLNNTLPNYRSGCPYLLVAIKIATFFYPETNKKLSSLNRDNIRKLSFRNRDTIESYHSTTVTFIFYLFLQWQRLINVLTIVTRPVYCKSQGIEKKRIKCFCLVKIYGN